METKIVTEKKGSGETVRQSLLYSAVGNLGNKGISLLGFFILARLLSPREFGVMAMVTVFTGVADLFLTLGMDSAIIQNLQATERHYSSAFWVNLILGATSSALIFVGSGAIADFYATDELITLLRVTSALFILDAIVVVPIALLKKRKQFKQIATIELVSNVFGIALGIYLAYIGWGGWALISDLLVTAVVEAILAFGCTKWMPSFALGGSELADLWKFSSYLLGSNFINYAINNVDYVLVGKMLGSKVLGVYKYAFQVAQFPQSIVYGVVSRVFFSLYSEHQTNKAYIKTMHLKAIRVISLVTIPTMAGLSALSDYFVLALLGQKWIDMPPILSLLAIIFTFDTIGVLNTPLFLSQGKTKLLFWMSLLIRSDLILAIVVGIKLGGINGLLIGLLCAKIVNFFPVFYISGRLVGIQLREILSSLACPVALSVLMVFGIRMTQRILNLRAGGVFDFALLVTVGLAIYAIGILLFCPHIYREAVDFLNPRKRSVV